jgi:hypothetical protein
MEYPKDMFVQQMKWAEEHWRRCAQDSETPLSVVCKWADIFLHFARELRKINNEERGQGE